MATWNWLVIGLIMTFVAIGMAVLGIAGVRVGHL